MTLLTSLKRQFSIKKLIESNKKVTSNKTKYVDAEKKLNDCNFIHKTNKSCFRGS